MAPTGGLLRSGSCGTHRSDGLACRQNLFNRRCCGTHWSDGCLLRSKLNRRSSACRQNLGRQCCCSCGTADRSLLRSAGCCCRWRSRLSCDRRKHGSRCFCGTGNDGCLQWSETGRGGLSWHGRACRRRGLGRRRKLRCRSCEVVKAGALEPLPEVGVLCLLFRRQFGELLLRGLCACSLDLRGQLGKKTLRITLDNLIRSSPSVTPKPFPEQSGSYSGHIYNKV